MSPSKGRTFLHNKELEKESSPHPQASKIEHVSKIDTPANNPTPLIVDEDAEAIAWARFLYSVYRRKKQNTG